MSDRSFVHAAPPAFGLFDPSYDHDACGIGFVAHLRGDRTHHLVRNALEMLVNLAHRSATGGDETGDGAGILVHTPHALLRSACRAHGIPLPDAGTYGVGMLFLPAADVARRKFERCIERIVAQHGCQVLGWRDVPVRDAELSVAARRTRPAIRQMIVATAALDQDLGDPTTLERTLYVIRRAIERAALDGAPDGRSRCYVASLSSRTIVYKGLLRPEQLALFYEDLSNPELASGLALVHSRFSTNTFPSWPLAHPYRFLCHNGEINTLRGNVNWMRIREPELASTRFTDTLNDLCPIVQPNQSDSASLDNVLELFVHSGRPLAHAMAMLIPEAWEGHEEMSAERRAFYDYHASVVEPWDGPAAVAFTDGRHIGAVQDRNGLRPARWLLTDDDVVVLASEVGAYAIAPERIREQGRLQPGRMLLVNTTQGRLLHDDEIKGELAALRPYRRWVNEHRRHLAVNPSVATAEIPDLRRMQWLFGYTREELTTILHPMADSGEEPVGSMGNDTPLAILSTRRPLLFSYFRQLFAQVTNPAIDPIRERIVMSLRMLLGRKGNLLDETPEHARHLVVEHPVLTVVGMRALHDAAGAHTKTLSTVFSAEGGLEQALERLCDDAEATAQSGAEVLVLSDRDIGATNAPIPSLLALSAIHHHLIRCRARARVSLVVECGDAREVSHIALLFAYGASAVHPHLALATLGDSVRVERYVKAVEKGLLKVLSKMGISTLASYCGAQAWQAVGLDRALLDRHFTGTPSSLAGIGLSHIATDVLARHREAFAADEPLLLDAGSDHQYRAQGEHHNWSPRAIATLQHAARTGSATTFAEFSRIADALHRETTLRGLLDFAARDSVPLDDVEPASSIVRRFATGAMSFGSISREAHETLAVAMNRIGGRSNTGEGGEDPERFGTERNSAIKQVASARFGVTTEYLVSATELQIKIAQGAKPGEGGQLPGHKVDEIIARTRHSVPGVTLISPPPHHDIYSIEDLKQLIYDLRSVNPTASVSVKLVAEAGVGTVAAGVAKAGADLIVISGDSGGTGAAPLSSIKHTGVPWELGLGETQQTLMLNGLRDRVRLQTDGQLKTGRDVVIGALLGADEFGFATAPLIAEGCVMMRKCHLNTCPVGIATQDPVLRANFRGKPEHLINYLFFVADEARTLMARLGFRSFDELIGRTDVLRCRDDITSPRARTLDISALLTAASLPGSRRFRRSAGNARASWPSLDETLLGEVRRAIERGEAVVVERTVRNVNRAVGARISGEIARRHGASGLPPGTIAIRLRGSAGQSFGAFATRGLTLDLEGEANDYVAKGLSGGRVVVRAPKTARLRRHGAAIIGNTALYGATSGEVFIGGGAGERFAVRNSGAAAVVEAVGDHACEYMTGGVVVVIGGVGRNFAAGMSGGIAYIYDSTGTFRAKHTAQHLEVGAVNEVADHQTLHQLIEQHATLTGSRRAKQLLSHWHDSVRHFARVMPLEYKRALEQLASQSDGARYG